jgi:microcystin-dependent protein
VANTIQCLSYSVAGDAAAGAWLMRNRFITVEAGGGIENDGGTGALQRSALTGDVTAPAGSNTTTIAAGAVDYAMMQDVSATDRFLGRDTAGSGDVEEITVANAYLMTHGADPNADRISFWDDSGSAPGYLAPNASLTISATTFSIADADFGDVVTTSSGTAWAIDANSVALGTDTTGNYVLDVADGTGIDGTASAEGATYTPSLDLTEISSGTWGAGAFTAFTFNAGAVDPVVTFGSGTVTWSAVTTYNLDDQAELRFFEEDAGGTNYIGFVAPAALTASVTCTLENDANPIPDSCVGDGTDGSGSGGDEAGTAGDRGDITVGASGGTLTIENDAVSHAKYQNIVTDSLLGRDTAATGSPEELSVGGGIEFTGSGGIQRSALTGDITAAAGSNTTDIATGVVGANEIATDGVGAAEIGTDAVGTSEIATDGVGSAEIAAGAVGTSEIATDGVDSAEIATSAVGAAEIATDAVATGEIAANAVQTDEIQDGTITDADLSTATSNKLRDVGEIITYAGSTCPNGSVEANGAAVSRTTYSALFAVIAETWGDGDNSTTFEVPDLRGRFLRGWDHASARDPDAASRSADNGGGNSGDNVGSWQDHEFESHTHGFNAADEGTGISDAGSGANAASESSQTTSASGGNETRPENSYVLFCVYTGV